MMKLKIFLLIALILPCSNLLAADLGAEIQKLNHEYHGAMPYPIVILDKTAFKKHLGQNDFLPENEGTIAASLQSFIKKYHQLDIITEDAVALASILVSAGHSALAQPFLDHDSRPSKVRSCFVLPATSQNTHDEEIQRVLGADALPEIYKNLDLRRLRSLLSQDELQLFSLYHELSHCLDQTFLPKNFETEPDGHGIHLSEAFAEVHALMMLAQKKDLHRLGAPRSLLRAIYSAHYGPYLATQPPSMAGPVYNQGGTIYFLVQPLLEAQRFIDRGALAGMTLSQTLDLAKTIVEHHAIKPRTFQAVHRYFAEGPVAISDYERMAQEAPDLFLQTFQELLAFQQVILHTDTLLPH